jgi:hypothetical protein
MYLYSDHNSPPALVEEASALAGEGVDATLSCNRGEQPDSGGRFKSIVLAYHYSFNGKIPAES